MAAAGPATGAQKVLVLHDEDDEIIPIFAEGKQIVADWPGARLQATRGLGHNRILRDADVVQAAVAFISQ